MSRMDRGSSGGERKHKESVHFDSPLKNAAMDRRSLGSACEKHPTGSTRWRYDDSSRPQNWRADGDGDEAPLVEGPQEGNRLG